MKSQQRRTAGWRVLLYLLLLRIQLRIMNTLVVLILISVPFFNNTTLLQTKHHCLPFLTCFKWYGVVIGLLNNINNDNIPSIHLNRSNGILYNNKYLYNYGHYSCEHYWWHIVIRLLLTLCFVVVVLSAKE